MPPKLEDGSTTERIPFLAPASLVKKIDDWRRRQPHIPSRAEAIRVLVDRALAAEPDGPN